MSLGQFLDDLVDLAAGATVTFTPVATVDKNNQAATLGAPVAYTTYVAGPVKFMHRESAQEKVSSQTLYVFTPNAIAATDVVTMPSVSASASGFVAVPATSAVTAKLFASST